MQMAEDIYLLPYSGNDSSQSYGILPAPLIVTVEPAGRWFEARLHRQHHRSSTSLRESGQEGDDDESSSSEEEDEYDEEEDEVALQNLDPKEWKNQDHYAVLGLSKLRYKASEDAIKKSYKKKVLKHHPDKRKARGLPVKDGEGDYFTCISKAYEILGNRLKRRSYDSVDPQFDDEIPDNNQDAKDHFYETFREAFERNARFSNSKSVPSLGDDNSSWNSVERFYQFWYDFDSWREFSYLDEEEKEKGESREERRWIEKQNKAERQKRKKEEIARIRQLVDNAYACDPRIKKRKEDEKKRKADVKKAKQDAIKAAAMEREKQKQAAEEAERLAKEKADEEAKAKAQAAKKEKEAQRKALRKERKQLRETCKNFNFFSSTEEERVHHMQEVEKLCEKLSVIRLQSLNEKLGGTEETAKLAFLNQIETMNKEIEEEKQEELRKQRESQSQKSGGAGGGKNKAWDDADVKLLIKAVNLFPAGTVARYEVIANFINSHSTSGLSRTAKDVIGKTKDLQKLDPFMKDEVNKKAFDKFEQSKSKPKREDAGVTPSEKSDVNGESERPWTADEQKRLEQALKTYPAQTAERWDKIAAAVPTRDKKECMKRYKELVEMIRAKKAAQQKVAQTKKP